METTEMKPESPASKYIRLTRNFFRGSQKGQIASLWKAREADPQKITDFKSALECGDVTLNYEELTKSQRRKLIQLGIPLPESVPVTSVAPVVDAPEPVVDTVVEAPVDAPEPVVDTVVEAPVDAPEPVVDTVVEAPVDAPEPDTETTEPVVEEVVDAPVEASEPQTEA